MKILLKDKGKYCFDVFDEDYQIGVVELFVDDKFWLNLIQVFDDCRGKKYGPAIIQHLVEKFNPFRLSLSSKVAHYSVKGSNDKRYLTSDGLHLGKTCFQNGILSRHHFEFPYPSDELVEYRADRFLDNRNPNILNFINSLILMIKK